MVDCPLGGKLGKMYRNVEIRKLILIFPSTFSHNKLDFLLFPDLNIFTEKSQRKLKHRLFFHIFAY